MNESKSWKCKDVTEWLDTLSVMCNSINEQVKDGSITKLSEEESLKKIEDDIDSFFEDKQTK